MDVVTMLQTIFVLKVSSLFGNFQKGLEIFRTVRKLSTLSETFHTVKKISRLSGNFQDPLETFRIL